MQNVLRRGAEGASVRALQGQLNRVGCVVKVDGDFGPATAAAVARFQKAYGLQVDEEVGPKTRQKLDEILNKRAVAPGQDASVVSGLAGLLDDENGPQTDQGKVAAGILELLSEGQGGGFGGFLEQLGMNGLGLQVASWVSTNADYQGPPPTADELAKATPEEFMEALVVKTGLGASLFGLAFGAVVPALISELTPNGTVPDGGTATAMMTSALDKKGKRKRK